MYHDQRLYTFINANKQEKNDSFLNDSTDAEHLCSEKVESPLVTGQNNSRSNTPISSYFTLFKVPNL